MGIGSIIITTSTRNINTPWYIVIPNNVSLEKQSLLVTVGSYAARTGLHWNISGNSPDIVKATRNRIIPCPMRRMFFLGNIRMMNTVRLVLTAVATNRYAQRETYIICAGQSVGYVE